jgi:hypothetical protein
VDHKRHDTYIIHFSHILNHSCKVKPIHAYSFTSDPGSIRLAVNYILVHSCSYLIISERLIYQSTTYMCAYSFLIMCEEYILRFLTYIGFMLIILVLDKLCRGSIFIPFLSLSSTRVIRLNSLMPRGGNGPGRPTGAYDLAYLKPSSAHLV